MTDQHRVNTHIKDQVAYVQLSRPEKHNALDMAMFQAIVRTIKQLRKNRQLRAIILSGDGPDFCTGLDVKSLLKSTSGPLKLLFKLNPRRSNMAQQVSTGWQDIPIPVIAAIHGRCWGGGLHIALGADIRIASPDASLSVMEGRWGLIPDMGGLETLRRHCRLDVAKELTFTSALLNGEQAKDAGLVTHVETDPMAAAERLVATLNEQSPDALAGVKKLYNKSWSGSKEALLMRETWYQLRVILGKNSKIKAYNQTHETDQQKSFQPRKRW
jgi:enoyl-CoA hydratase/carnithine racemase